MAQPSPENIRRCPRARVGRKKVVSCAGHRPLGYRIVAFRKSAPKLVTRPSRLRHLVQFFHANERAIPLHCAIRPIASPQRSLVKNSRPAKFALAAPRRVIAARKEEMLFPESPANPLNRRVEMKGHGSCFGASTAHSRATTSNEANQGGIEQEKNRTRQ